MKTSPESLSVVIPVHNDAQTLAKRVSELLEILPELTRQFEILIVDNGSTDLTEEVAYDLVRQFPQVRVARKSARQQTAGLLEIGMEHTTGALIIFLDEEARVLPSRLRQLWNLRTDEGLPMACANQPGEEPVVERLKQWARQLPGDQNGYGLQIIRRAAVPRQPSGGQRFVPATWSTANTANPTA